MKLSKLLLSSLITLPLLHTGIAAAEDADTQKVQAQWQPRELTFHYMGFSTYYSCTSIEDRLEQILRDLGAKTDVRVAATGCMSPVDVSGMITARIRLNMPVESSTATNGEGASFEAQQKLVSLKTHDDRQVGSGDCELLEQVRNQIVPALKLKVVRDDLHCIPGQAVLSGRGLEVQSLVPVDKKLAAGK